VNDPDFIKRLHSKDLEPFSIDGGRLEPTMIWRPNKPELHATSEPMTQWDLLTVLSKLPREDLHTLLLQVGEFPSMVDTYAAELNLTRLKLKAYLDPVDKDFASKVPVNELAAVVLKKLTEERDDAREALREAFSASAIESKQ
jgi:hypothetical protein